MKRGRWILIAVGATAALIALRLTLLAPKPIEVEIHRVARGEVEDAVTNSRAGTVRSRRRARLGVELAATVAAIPHREGSRVHRGEVLLHLNAGTARMQLELADRDVEAARAAVVSAEAAAALAEQNHERAVRLGAERVISQEDLDQATSRRDVATGELKAARARALRAEAALRLARDHLDRHRIAAPFDGVITQRFVEVGEAVTPGQPVLEILSASALYVSAPIDEIDVGRVREGLPARITLDPYPGLWWDGVVTRVAPYLDDVQEQNRTLEIEVDMAPNDSLPWPRPGTSADVEIVLDRREDTMRVPTLAVIDGRRVLVAERGRAREKEVETGLKNWEWTEVTSGLAEGEPVITNLDRQGLRAGVRVAMKDGTNGAAWAKP